MGVDQCFHVARCQTQTGSDTKLFKIDRKLGNIGQSKHVAFLGRQFGLQARSQLIRKNDPDAWVLTWTFPRQR